MIPNSSSHEEDDGWVLVLIWEGETQSNQLIILKANDLTQQTIIDIPIKIPYGLHGSWVNSTNH